MKGVTNNFSPTKDFFHFIPIDASLESKPLELNTIDLKALFFVKDFDGKPAYNEKREFDSTKPLVERKIRVVFKDGELMVGTTNGYHRNRQGFFINPVDSNSNNERCFVFSAATKEVSLI